MDRSGAQTRRAAGSSSSTFARRAAVAALVLVLLGAVVILGRALVPPRRVASLIAAPRASATAKEDEPARVAPELSGRVLDADGNPVAEASVRVLSTGPQAALLAETKSDRGGHFAFALAAAGVVRVAAAHAPEGVVTSSEVHEGGAEPTPLTLVLAPANVRGVVVDAQGHAIAGATVTPAGPPWAEPGATSDGAGTFQLSAVPYQATTLGAVARGFRSVSVPLGSREDLADVVLTITMEAAGPIDGDVLDADGDPARAHVVACRGTAAELSAFTAEDGSFRLPPSAIGCEVTASNDGLGASATATVVEGQRLRLRLGAPGSIEGVAVDDRGEGLPSFTVGIEAASEGRAPRGARDFDNVRGIFLVDKLAAGTYVLTATAAGKPPARSAPIEVKSGARVRGVRLVVPQGGSVMGRVVDERGAPLAGVELRFDLVSSVVESSATATTGGDGRYRLDAAPSGPFTLRVRKDGFRTRLVPGLRVDSNRTVTADVQLTSNPGGRGFELTGIGATLAQSAAGISIGSVLAGAPAEKEGLRGGDRLLEIDGDDVSAMSLSDAIQALRGPVAVPVAVAVERDGRRIDVLIVRAPVVL